MGAREAEFKRTTKETEIIVNLNVDGSGKAQIDTGIGFLDHMLDALARHSRFDLEIIVKGDLHIDEHHTVEDTAIGLGRALDQALGDHAGITRMGHAIVPLDDSLAMTAVDFGGRGYCAFNGHFDADCIGQLPTALIPHFLETLAREGRMNLHVQLLAGQEDHHRAEAIFKALARALDLATRLDDRISDEPPSTKGVID